MTQFRSSTENTASKVGAAAILTQTLAVLYNFCLHWRKVDASASYLTVYTGNNSLHTQNLQRSEELSARHADNRGRITTEERRGARIGVEFETRVSGSVLLAFLPRFRRMRHALRLLCKCNGRNVTAAVQGTPRIGKFSMKHAFCVETSSCVAFLSILFAPQIS